MNYDRLESVAQAHRRYPDMPIELALACLQSDKQRAGLGALDKARRRGHNGISNTKERDLMTGRVHYVLSRHTREHMRYPQEFADWSPGGSVSATVTVERVPERHQVVAVRVERHELQGRHGRRNVVAMLLEARRQLRRALEE